MENLPIVLIILAVVAVVGGLIYLNYWLEKKRTEALSAAADALGFTFAATPGETLVSELGSFPLFSQGHSKRVRNLMRGEANGMQVRLFDYQFTVGHGKHKHTARQTVVCFHLPGTVLPTFSLRPESFWHKIGTFFGYQDINFDSHPRFSSAYLLRGSDVEAIRGLFREDVLTHFEEHAGLSTEGSGDHLLVYRDGKRTNPPEIRTFLESGFEVLALFRRAEG